MINTALAQPLSQDRAVQLHYLLSAPLLVVAAIVCTLFSWSSWAAETLNVYTYHDKPPYFSHADSQHESSQAETTNPQLYRAFIDLINSKQDVWKLELTHLPRKRLDLQIKGDQINGAVMGVNPLWFNDRSKQRYLWSAGFMHDTDVVVVSRDKPIPYQHPDDLTGKTLALQRGLYLWGITEQAAAGNIQILETTSDIQNLKLVTLGRVDATIMSRLTLRHFQRTDAANNQLMALPEPHDRFARHLMFTRQALRAFEQLAPTIDAVSNSAEWQEQLYSYY